MTEEASEPKPNLGGRPYSQEDMAALLTRREKAVELKARGWSYAEIARFNKCGWSAAYTDVQSYLQHMALYYNAREFREQIAATYRADIKAADDVLVQLEEVKEDWAYEVRVKAITARTKAANGLARVYGFVGEKSFYLGSLTKTAGEGIMDSTRGWARGLSKEKVAELREMVLGVYRARHEPAEIPAEFTVDEEETPIETPPPPSENGHSENGHEDEDGPVTMSGG